MYMKIFSYLLYVASLQKHAQVSYLEKSNLQCCDQKTQRNNATKVCLFFVRFPWLLPCGFRFTSSCNYFTSCHYVHRDKRSRFFGQRCQTICLIKINEKTLQHTLKACIFILTVNDYETLYENSFIKIEISLRAGEQNIQWTLCRWKWIFRSCLFHELATSRSKRSSSSHQERERALFRNRLKWNSTRTL